jgi:hypothetical protein
MTDAGGQTYTVAVDRDTRKFTISAAAPFELLITSGSHVGTTAFGLAGFSGADTASATSHESANGAGSVYTTQFILQSYIAPEHYRNSTYGTVNKSASGKIEVVSYGIESFVQAEIKYANDNDNGGSVIRYNPTGVADLTALMVFLTKKAPLEFIPDEDDTGTFISVVLESTPDDAKGLKFKLKEMYGDGLPGYFQTGALTFRVLDDE